MRTHQEVALICLWSGQLYIFSDVLRVNDICRQRSPLACVVLANFDDLLFFSSGEQLWLVLENDIDLWLIAFGDIDK